MSAVLRRFGPAVVLARTDLLALPTAGVLFLIGFLLRGPLATSTDQLALASARPAYDFAWLLLVLGSVSASLGGLGLYRLLSDGRQEQIARWALRASVAAWVLEAALQGVYALLGSTAGDPSIAAGVLSTFTAIPNFLVLFFFEGALGLAGGLLFGQAIWRSGALPRWVAAAYAPHIILLNNTGGASFAGQILGALCLLFAGIGIAATAWSATPGKHGGTRNL